MSEWLEPNDEMYSCVKPSKVRLFLVSAAYYTAATAGAMAVTAWLSGKPALLAMAPLGGIAAALGMAYRHRHATLERVEGTLWGPAGGGWFSSDADDRMQIRLGEIDRNAEAKWGALPGLFGWRRICGHRGQEIRYCRLWYDPTDLDTFLMRIGLT